MLGALIIEVAGGFIGDEERGPVHQCPAEGDSLLLTDYKTGKAPPEQYAISAFFALKIYALLIRNRLGRTPTSLRLLYLNGPTVYEIPVSKNVLASRLGTVPETFSRTLKKLQEEGKIRVRGNQIRILKADSLFGTLAR